MHDAFAALHAATRETLASLAHQWAAGEWSAGGFAEQMDRVLLDAHTTAVVIGRAHAGDDTPEEADDAHFAGAVMGTEREFLDRFHRDMTEGRYTGEDGVRDGETVAARATMYADRLTGTANEAWALTLPEETVLVWTLGGDAETACSDCPEIAAGSPYTPASIPTYPGKNETLCMTRCRCACSLESGQAGFVTPG